MQRVGGATVTPCAMMTALSVQPELLKKRQTSIQRPQKEVNQALEVLITNVDLPKTPV
jgi:hypothetical protein